MFIAYHTIFQRLRLGLVSVSTLSRGNKNTTGIDRHQRHASDRCQRLKWHFRSGVG